MGGMGSGLYGNGGKKGRPTIENCRELNINKLKREKALELPSFTYSWSDQDGERTGQVFFLVKPERLIALYKVNGEQRAQSIFFVESIAGYGVRKWFGCPRCENRRSSLYLASGEFACRECHDLNYRSSQTNDDLEYFHWQLRKLCKLLQADYDPMSDIAPPRPTGMRKKKYERLCSRYENLAYRRNVAFIRIAGGIIRR